MFILSWLPYSMVCIYRTIWGGSDLSPFMMTLPAMFAKSSMFLPPLFYILFNKNISDAFMELVNIAFDLRFNSDFNVGLPLNNELLSLTEILYAQTTFNK